MMTLQQQLASQGFCLVALQLPQLIRDKIVNRNWEQLDSLIHKETRPEGIIFQKLREFSFFTSIEFIISIRSSNITPDDDGIWHDDGSRILAFSLSLTLDPPLVQGGALEVRKKGGVSSQISTPPYGTMIVFATGHSGYEHKINRVTAGERIIIAGWCT